MQFVLYFFAATFALGFAATYPWLSLLIVIGAVAPRLIRHLRMKKYFASPEFLAHKDEVAAVVAEYNDLSGYVDEIKAKGQFNIGESSTGNQAHLASFQNTSAYNYRRDRNVAQLGLKNVHNTSLQVVRNAAIDPIKYLIKYFGIESSEEKLAEIESLGDSYARLQNAVENLRAREASISYSIAPPKFILKHYLKQFREQIGLSIPPLSVPYPVYSFEYVSAGGNSSQTTKIELNSQSIDALIETISAKIKFKKSAAGQRSLMTAAFREYIKNRDGYACKICQVSVQDEQHLLLEVDHIQPVSRGGLSVESNLQTLCWKCNRTKSNKTATA